MALLCFAILVPGIASADCATVSAGTKPEGFMFYNTDNRVIQFCDGTDWIKMHRNGSGSGGCANPAKAEGSIRYNEDARVLQGCAGNVWRAMGPVQHVPNAVNFDGTNDWLLKSGDYTGVSDTSKVTGSFWVRRNATGVQQDVFYKGSASGEHFRIQFKATDVLAMIAEVTDPTRILQIQVDTAVDDTDWHHFLFSIDLSDTGKRHVYLDGASVPVTYFEYDTSAQFLLTNGGNTGIGASFGGGGKSNIDLADLWLDFGTYIDLSVPANRHRFIDANGNTVSLGADGSKPTGSAPDVFLSGDTTDWHNNKGTGGGFTENGALTNAANKPGAPDLDISLTTGLIGHWKLDETSGTTAGDSAGTNNGTMQSGLDAGNDSTAGVVDVALDFDGADDFINITGSADLFETPPFSVAAWFRLDSFQVTDTGTIISKRNTSSPWNNWNMFIRWSSPRNIAWSASGPGPDFVSDVVDSNSPITTGQWYHVVGVIDSDFNMSLYVDGVKQADTGSIPGLLDSDASVAIGAWNAANSRTDGQIDDVRIYDRVLSEQEIRMLAKGDCGAPQRPTGTLLYNSSGNVMQYCDGADWVRIGKSPAAPPDPCAGTPSPGDVCADGSIFAGDTNLYVTDVNQSTSIQWSTETVNTGADSTVDGAANQAWIVANETLSQYPAFELCETIDLHGHQDWYLPAKDELNTLYTNKAAIGGFTAQHYFSSTESGMFPSSSAWTQQFSDGAQFADTSKSGNNDVRCVRRN